VEERSLGVAIRIGLGEVDRADPIRHTDPTLGGDPPHRLRGLGSRLARDISTNAASQTFVGPVLARLRVLTPAAGENGLLDPPEFGYRLGS
jgi:hypothetical protein